MFDVRRARALHAVARYGTVSAAAEALHVTSSALSQQLAKLEREVGQPLLTQQGRGVALTDAGTLLVEHTQVILDRMSRAETDLEAQLGQVTGRMAIAAFATATRTILPATLRHLREHYTQLRVESHEHEPDPALALLVRGDVDIALIDEWSRPHPSLPEGVQALHLLDDVTDLAVPADHPLAGSGRVIDLSAVADEPWITWGGGCSAGRDWLRGALSEYRPDPDFAHTAGEHPTLLSLVSAGLGIALIPRLGRGPLPAGVSLEQVRPAATRRAFVLWRSDAEARPAVRVAIEALQRAARAEQS